MQDELRITFFVIGILFIVGILLHGVWTIRKNKKLNDANSFQSGRAIEPKFDRKKSDKHSLYEQRDTELESDSMFDDVDVGKARIINPVSASEGDDIRFDDNAQPSHQRSPHASPQNKADSDENSVVESALSSELNVDIDSIKDDLQSNDDSLDEALSSSFVGENVGEDTATIGKDAASTTPVYSGVVTQPKPEFDKTNKIQDVHIVTEEAIPEPPGFLLKTAVSEEGANKTLKSEHETAGNGEQKGKNEDLNTPSDFSLDVQEGPVNEITEEPNQHDVASVEKELSFAEQAKRFMTRRKKTVAEKIRQEPKSKVKNKQNDDQMRMDFETSDSQSIEVSEQPTKNEQSHNLASNNSESNNLASNSSASNNSTSSKSENKQQEQSQTSAQSDVLVLNIKADTDHPISGAALLPMLLTLGFKFGEHDVFHRHVNTNGKGPVLFSLTNMFKPGVFDIDNLENFSTLGVSLFMMLPIEGDAQQVFNMMHNAARKLAEEFDCKILDGNKVLLSKQSLQQYSERIRKFERQQQAR